MSSKHQVYIRLPERFYGATNPNNKPIRVEAIYIHNSFGQALIRSLCNFFEWYKNAESSPNDLMDYRASYLADHASDILLHLWSCDPAAGYFCDSASKIVPWEDPDRGENDTGITLIDLTQAEPAYCFMFIYHSVGNRSDKYKPRSAEQFIRFFYPHYQTETKRVDYRFYPPKETDMTEFHLRTIQVIQKLSPVRVLTQEEARRFFPKGEHKFY